MTECVRACVRAASLPCLPLPSLQTTHQPTHAVPVDHYRYRSFVCSFVRPPARPSTNFDESEKSSPLAIQPFALSPPAPSPIAIIIATKKFVHRDWSSTMLFTPGQTSLSLMHPSPDRMVSISICTNNFVHDYSGSRPVESIA